ncbi:DUF4097 family beta strand repeat-containing protein [Haloechinothrix halophila]|uniref:DUF4097 family beta strand repeat-containing protein n=1 Tax=Haloechinothrix halophila TaxID=1069073 RepID=UPI000426705C|nr:DUF4097 family beta strand repeat-containing protein [Haloechinothrix halophila]
MTEPNDAGGTEQPELVRTQEFPTDGPIELDLSVTTGRIDVLLSGDAAAADAADDSTRDTTSVAVELRHDTGSGSPWTQGVASTLAWLSEQFRDQLGPELAGSASDAIEQTRIDMLGGRLVVRAPKQLPLRHVPLALTVRAPAGSHLEIKTGSARVTVTGAAGRATLHTSSGDVALERATSAVTVRSGSGSVSLGPTASGLHVRTGGGDVRASDTRGSATVVTGTGSVYVAAAEGELVVRSGSGDVTVADAGPGGVNVRTGSGAVRVGVRSGVHAEVDVTSGSGTASSELEVADAPPGEDVPLHIRASTGSGNAVIASASA